MENDNFFIDYNGNKISSENVSSHSGLSKLIIESDNQLKDEFEKSNYNDMTDFLVLDKGYLKVGNIGGYYRVITFASSKISDIQRRILLYYKEEGYRFDNLSRMERYGNNNGCR